MAFKAPALAAAAAALVLWTAAPAAASYTIGGEAARMMLTSSATQTQIIGACNGNSACIGMVNQCFQEGGKYADVDARPSGGSVTCYGNRGIA